MFKSQVKYTIAGTVEMSTESHPENLTVKELKSLVANELNYSNVNNITSCDVIESIETINPYGDEPSFSTLEAEEDGIRVSLEYIGEGYEGDFNPDDEEDVPLLRFTVEQREPGTDYWEQVDDSSYCTQIPIDTPRGQLRSLAKSILSEVKEPVLSGHSIKKLCERLSWIAI